MFHPITIDITRGDDFSVFNNMRQLTSELKLKGSTVAIVYVAKSKPSKDQAHYQPIRVEKNQPFESAEVEKLFKKESYDMMDMSFHFHDEIKITITRPMDSSQNKLTLGNDTLRIEIENNKNDLEQLSAITNASRLIFKSLDTAFLPKLISEDLEKYYTVRENGVGRLENKITEVATYFTEFRLSQEKKLQEDKDKLHIEHQKVVQADKEAHQKRMHEVDERENKLKEREAKIDDRENVHARRQAYQDIKKKLEKRKSDIKLTTDTSNKRKSISTVTYWAIGMVSLVFLICFCINIWGSGTNWAAIGTQIGSAIALGMLVTFLIRWQNVWFREHADEEFKLHKLDLDIDRATWLVELALEWEHQAKEGKPGMPPEMLTRLSNNLFTNTDAQFDIHPLETMISGLIGDKGKLEAGANQIKVERQGKGTGN